MDAMLTARTRTKRIPKLTYTIVLSWCTTRWNGLRHVTIVHACVWRNNVGAGEKHNVDRMLRDDQIELSQDARMATSFAYPSSESDPLGKARETMRNRFEIMR